jgi:hypothetical protein
MSRRDSLHGRCHSRGDDFSSAKRVGDDMSVNMEYMTSLPRSRVGKLRLVVSEIAAASIEKPACAEAESARRVARS